MREIFLNQLYKILGLLQEKEINNGFHFLADPVPVAFIQSGMYFFFDIHIPRHAGGNKIIRIGITGNNNNNRLLLHQNGNINVSVFRSHVGNALKQHNQEFDEISINKYIHPLPYLYLPIAHQDNLKTLEKRMIEIVSNHRQPVQIDTPTSDWLGYHAIKPAICKSHLWNVHHVGKYQSNNENIYHEALVLLAEYVNNLT